MKRAIACVGILVFALTVAFDFQVNTASAKTLSCKVAWGKPCVETISSGDELNVSITPGEKIVAIAKDTSSTKTATIQASIGTQAQEAFNIESENAIFKAYSTSSADRSLTFVNDSTAGVEVIMAIFKD